MKKGEKLKSGTETRNNKTKVSYKVLIEENSYYMVEINNAADDPLSVCPYGNKLEISP